jgi:AraC-like DNA-binding protein
LSKISVGRAAVQPAKIFVNFTGTVFPEILARFGINDIYVYPGLDIYNELSYMLDIIKSKNPEAPSYCASVIFKIICKMYEYAHSSNIREYSDGYRLKQYIDLHYSSTIDISCLSGLIDKSESQVIRIFKHEFGITPHRYILNKKIEAAKILLLKTELPVKKIASELSFADEFYFSNAFKKIVGLSPKNYRASTDDEV